jgi:hypothetical protein
MTSRAANDLAAVRRPRRMMTTSHDEPDILAARFHHINSAGSRVDRKAIRSPFGENTGAISSEGVFGVSGVAFLPPTLCTNRSKLPF